MSGDLSTTKLRAFLPGGKDFALSKRFYQALGFEIEFEASGVAGLRCDSGSFLLQDYFHEGWAHNFMMHLTVADLDAWWAHIESLDLPGNFGVSAPKPPEVMPWGLRIAYVVGPCGELWHIAQA